MRTGMEFFVDFGLQHYGSSWNVCVYSSRRFPGDTIGEMFEDSVNVLCGRSEMLT